VGFEKQFCNYHQLESTVVVLSWMVQLKTGTASSAYITETCTSSSAAVMFRRSLNDIHILFYDSRTFMKFNGRISMKSLQFPMASVPGLSKSDETFDIAMSHPVTNNPIFLFSDPSHWIKKARNSVESR
jgi:hypothetical protein